MKTIMLILLVAFTLLPRASFAQQSKACKEASYVDRNQIDYGPLVVQTVVGQASDLQQVPVPKVCVALFAEASHNLVATTETDEAGRFSLESVPPGDYRLVALYDPLCPANARLRVAKPTNRARLQVHLQPRGIDKCSYIDLGKSTARLR